MPAPPRSAAPGSTRPAPTHPLSLSLSLSLSRSAPPPPLTRSAPPPPSLTLGALLPTPEALPTPHQTRSVSLNAPTHTVALTPPQTDRQTDRQTGALTRPAAPPTRSRAVQYRGASATTGTRRGGGAAGRRGATDGPRAWRIGVGGGAVLARRRGGCVTCMLFSALARLSCAEMLLPQAHPSPRDSEKYSLFRSLSPSLFPSEMLLPHAHPSAHRRPPALASARQRCCCRSPRPKLPLPASKLFEHPPPPSCSRLARQAGPSRP